MQIAVFFFMKQLGEIADFKRGIHCQRNARQRIHDHRTIILRDTAKGPPHVYGLHSHPPGFKSNVGLSYL